ncbi:MAG TPA: citrate/2-methylcitrate synthase [Planctomycetaceae bacterium]|nr:citrate/2-methylcitrate synthase [Planctomycetaceae bacterium]
MNQEAYHPGLEGVIAGETAISTIAGGLQYFGYSITDLAEGATFEEVAWLLLHGELPSEEQLADFRAILAESSSVSPAIIEFLRAIPADVSSMDVLRTGISALAHFDPQVGDNSPAADLAKSQRLLAQIPILIAARHRIRHGQPVLQPQPEMSLAANLLYLITGKEPTAAHERAMDVSLILYAEHEYNASTFTARVVTSTMADMHSAIVAAVGALKGPLHGGANERVLEVLEEVGSPDRAEQWVRQALAEKRRIMGFGHRVYKDGDPRARILKDHCARLAAEAGDTSLERTAEIIEQRVRGEKGLPPNLDWPSARLYHYLGLPVDLFTPLFVASRVTGWCAHVMEQAANNRLIRPRARYIGPAERTFEPLSERG